MIIKSTEDFKKRVKLLLDRIDDYKNNNPNVDKDYLESQIITLCVDDHERRVKSALAPVSERNYTKEQMIAAAKYGYEYHESTSYPEKNFEDNCKNNTEQWLIGVIDTH